MADLVTIAPIWLILLVLIVAIPAIIKCITFIINTVRKHNANQAASFEKGMTKQQKITAQEEVITKLAEREDKLEAKLQEQQDALANLATIVTDLALHNNLMIKQDIKLAWERVHAGGALDLYELDILNQRFEIYRRNGGNSWAMDMMKEIRDKSITTQPIDLHHHDD